MKLLLFIPVLLLNISFAKASLTLEHSSGAWVVPGTSANCSDKRSGNPSNQSVSSDFFALSTFNLNWQGTDYLVPSMISVSMKHPYIAGGSYQCTISGGLLEDTFGPAPYPTGIVKMNGGFSPINCSMLCGGVKRAPGHENTNFSATATVEMFAHSESLDGMNTTPVRASSSFMVVFY